MNEAISVAADVVLTEISITELEGSLFSPGDIYWVKKNGTRVRVVESGGVIDHDYLRKFEGIGNGLQVDRISKINIVGDGKMLFFALGQARTEGERIVKRLDLLRWFRNIYWSGTHRGSLLDLVKIGTEVFYKFDDDVTDRLRGASNFLFKRSALVGSVAVFICLSAGYLDYKFLSDIYHLCFLFDFAFEQKSLSYNLLKATELERRKSGDGISCLFLGENPGPELATFQFHPRKGMLEAKELCAKYFTDPNLLHLIMKHHERVNGKGFPVGINEDEMSDLDNIIVFLNYLISFDDLKFKRNDGQAFLKKQLEQESFEDVEDIFGLRLKDMLIQVFDNLPEKEEETFEEEVS